MDQQDILILMNNDGEQNKSVFWYFNPVKKSLGEMGGE